MVEGSTIFCININQDICTPLKVSITLIPLHPCTVVPDIYYSLVYIFSFSLVRYKLEEKVHRICGHTMVETREANRPYSFVPWRMERDWLGPNANT